MEMMDKELIHATDNFVKAGYPRDAESMLIVELDGTETEVEELYAALREVDSAALTFLRPGSSQARTFSITINR